jgi:hypothetical protein
MQPQQSLGAASKTSLLLGFVETPMQRSITFSLLAAFPSLVLLAYLAAHATEGWQLLVVASFVLGFVVSWLRSSKTWLAASYLATAALFAWVLSANL